MTSMCIFDQPASVDPVMPAHGMHVQLLNTLTWSMQAATGKAPRSETFLVKEQHAADTLGTFLEFYLEYSCPGQLRLGFGDTSRSAAYMQLIRNIHADDEV